MTFKLAHFSQSMSETETLWLAKHTSAQTELMFEDIGFFS